MKSELNELLNVYKMQQKECYEVLEKYNKTENSNGKVSKECQRE